MTAARGPAFATAVRMVDRVLRDAARQRALAQPAIATRLGEVLVLVVGVRHRPDRRHALRTDIALLARIAAQHHHPAIATDDLQISACRASALAALARLHLHGVDDEIGRASCRERVCTYV